ncbi:MAG: hypothetical protein ACYC5Q_14930 [Thermoleophilia bacterium]
MREVTEREFVNYAKELGGYCTYADTRRVLGEVLQTLAAHLGIQSDGMRRLVPSGLGSLVGEALPAGAKPPAGAADPVQVLDLTAAAGLADRRAAEMALLTFFGSLKEKSGPTATEWQELCAGELAWYWERAATIDRVQDAGQCL